MLLQKEHLILWWKTVSYYWVPFLLFLGGIPDIKTLSLTNFDISVNATQINSFTLLDISLKSMLFVPGITTANSMMLGNASFFAV